MATSGSVIRVGVRLLFLFLGISAILAIHAPAEATANDPILGRWRWFNNRAYVFKEDGTVDHGGKWKCVSPNQDPRKYIVDWGNGIWIDTLYLKKYDTKLSGHNQEGRHIWATRLPE